MNGTKEENGFQRHTLMTKEKLRLTMNALFQPMFRLVPKVSKFRNSNETLSKEALKVSTHYLNGHTIYYNYTLEIIIN